MMRLFYSILFILGLAISAAAQTVTVTNTNDSGAGSLRQVVADAPAGATIVFAAALSGQTITLGGTHISLTKNVVIDASALPNGITISANNQSRIFEVSAGGVVTLRTLSMVNGQFVGIGRGGAIRNSGDLVLDRCLVANSSAYFGGGISVTENGTLQVIQSTMTGNYATYYGGAIDADGTSVTITQSTIAGNSAGFVGGAIEGESALHIMHSIVAGNSALFLPNIDATVLTNINNILSGDPRLAPLGNYGGPTKTMPPHLDSPAIDAGGETSQFTTDQRGAPRVVDGNGDGTAHVDIGAVEFNVIVVTSNADAGVGSLREAVDDPFVMAIRFSPALSGQTITLGGSQISIDKNMLIDASDLPDGITLSGNDQSRIFGISAGKNVTIRGFSLRNGRQTGGEGGAIRNAGMLTLDRMLISESTAALGGGVFSPGALTLRQSTLSGNHATSRGGGIHASGALVVTQSTISQNSAVLDGGGIRSELTLDLTGSIVAGNNAPLNGNINGLINSQSTSLVSGDPLLGPLADNGGPTATMLPLPGSPAIDAGGTTSPFATDQRGAPRVLDGNGDGQARVDIGAAEYVPPTVVTSTAGTGPGSLRAAIVAPFVPGATFAPALAGQTINLGGSQILIDRKFVIDGTALATPVTLTANGQSRLFEIAAGREVAIRGMILTHGAATWEFGGAILNHGELSLERCHISNSNASQGGGAYISETGTLHILQSTFSGNSANNGGALVNYGHLSVRESTLSHNTASGLGGGIFSWGVVTVELSTLSGNSAWRAGGIYHSGNIGAEITVDQSTISNNTASVSGGGIGNDHLNFILRDSIVAGNHAPGEPNIQNNAPIMTNSIISGDPMLLPLGNYGGPTQTMPPFPSSPVIDAGGTTTTFETDQRGAPRVLDGNGNGQARYDLGAVEHVSGIVITLADTGPGSLREKVANPLIPVITFAPALSGQTITLGGTQILLDRDATIDASALADGIAISGNSNGDAILDPGESRIFEIAAGNTVTLRGLHLKNGHAPPVGVISTSAGGAILNLGHLLIEDCEISGNRAIDGGAIFASDELGSLTIRRSRITANHASWAGGGIVSYQPLTLYDSTISANTADVGGGGLFLDNVATLHRTTFSDNHTPGPGGAIFAEYAPLTLIQCTLSGNTAGSEGGAIYNGMTLEAIHTTISNNTANDSGGGIFHGGSELQLTHSIVAGNTAPLDANVAGTEGLTATLSLTSGDPVLAPLGDYGGLTQTMPPLRGSPAINGAVVLDPPLLVDQRGYPIGQDGAPDIGSVEVALPMAIHRVDVNATGANDGTSWADAFTHLTSALAEALPHEEIWVAAGAYTPGTERADTFQLRSNIAIYGGFSGNETERTARNPDPATNATILSGDLGVPGDISDNVYHVVTGDGANATAILGGFTITGGNANAPGVMFDARGGGFISVTAGSPTLEDIRFVGNRASYVGGAVYLNASHPTFTRVSFIDNETTGTGETAVDGFGGAVYLNNSSPSFTNCKFTGNTGFGSGGAIHIQTGNPPFVNCLFSANRAGGNGGAIHTAIAANPSFTNCTIAQNTAQGEFGGIRSQGNLALTNSIIWNNSGTNSVSLTATINNSLIQHQNPGGTNLDGTLEANDPRFVNPIAGDFRLGIGSPAIDAGNNAANTTAFDLAGQPRVEVIIDLGAYEGAFDVVAPTGYAAWIAQYFPNDLLNPAIVAPDADPSGDGVANALVWILGGDPREPIDRNLLPSAVPDGEYLVFTYYQLPSLDGVVDVSAVYNSDLGASWTPAIHGENGIIAAVDADPAHPALDRHRIYLPTTIFSPIDRGFVRLSITPRN